jgi:hypothetical protein
LKSIKYATHYITLLEESLNDTDTAVDFTAGNGYDTLFLCSLAHEVYSFDIQKAAVDTTAEKVKAYGNCRVILDTHANFLRYVTSFKAGIFNLGYLPKGDKSIHTDALTVIRTMKAALPVMEVHGVLVIVIYPGYPEGEKESHDISEFSKTLDQKQYDVIRYEFINQINNPPYLIAIRRRQ